VARLAPTLAWRCAAADPSDTEAASRLLVELVTPLVYKWIDWRPEELRDEWRAAPLP
jgi:hypothetical protein